jgi:hypothetical protein
LPRSFWQRIYLGQCLAEMVTCTQTSAHPDLPELFMKKIKTVFPLLLLTVFSSAQKYESWKIFHNRNEAASFNLKKESGDENRVVLLNRDLDEPGFFVIEFTPVKEQAGWLRSFALVDKSDATLKEFNNTAQLKMHNSDLSDILTGREYIKIYSWAIPADPELAARVRVRRILLCTLYTR